MKVCECVCVCVYECVRIRARARVCVLHIANLASPVNNTRLQALRQVRIFQENGYLHARTLVR